MEACNYGQLTDEMIREQIVVTPAEPWIETRKANKWLD